jgi:hypothetical protein
VKPVGKPDAGNPHVRFDERGWETGRRSGVSARAHPRLYKLASRSLDGLLLAPQWLLVLLGLLNHLAKRLNVLRGQGRAVYVALCHILRGVLR